MATPTNHQSRGVTTPFASYVCAVTQFLSSTDLCLLDRVSQSDHAALDALWATCEAKCRGLLPVHELRRGTGTGGGNPRDTAYLWSVAHAVVTRWTDTLQQASSSAYVCQSFTLQPHGCLHCNIPKRHEYHNSEYVVSASYKAITHAIGTSGEDQRGCMHLRQIWLDATGIPIHQQNYEQIGPNGSNLPTTLLHVLIRLGPQIHHVFLKSPHRFWDPFVEVWVALGVMPRIPISTAMSNMEMRHALTSKWHNVVQFISSTFALE